jgi:hypothetical protein
MRVDPVFAGDHFYPVSQSVYPVSLSERLIRTLPVMKFNSSREEDVPSRPILQGPLMEMIVVLTFLTPLTTPDYVVLG